MDEQIRKLRDMLREASNAVFFGGAGVSTESGIPDFRSQDGLYKQKWKYPPETILSHSFFTRYTEEFYDFYRQKMLFPSASPNRAHRALARLEETGHLSCVITQNIDGLHQLAGSRNVIELHGSVHRNRCIRCGKQYPGIRCVTESSGIPRCSCGGVIKPEVVLYEEALNGEDIERAVNAVERADLLIIGGTSLTVYPAAAFAESYFGRLIVINRSATSMDRRADLLLDRSIGEALGEVVENL